MGTCPGHLSLSWGTKGVVLLVYALIAYLTICLPKRALKLLWRRRHRALCPSLEHLLVSPLVEEE